MVEKEDKKSSKNSIVQKSLRLWPGVLFAALLLLVRFGLILVMPEAAMTAVFGGFIGTFFIIVWWAFFSRASLYERWGGIALMIITLIITYLIIHESMGLMPFVTYIVPIQSIAFVVWAAISSRFSNRIRHVSMVFTLLFISVVWAFIRTDGVTGGFQSEFEWRWAETHEELLLAEKVDELSSPISAKAAIDTAAYWPGFRGTNRDGIIHGLTIETDWSVSPPVEIWRRMIGPGWSSFAVRGSLIYTQEQRGEDEVVSCYNISTGEPVWRHSDSARFWESNSGAGPRGTPTLMDGRIYSLGATGILNVLNAADGTLIWSRNTAADTDTKIPIWGFSGSPLVVNDLVITSASGSIIAYELNTGKPQWSNNAGGDCYSSPHLMHIDGIAQVVLLNEAGANSFALTDGSLIWNYSWPGIPIVQPAVTENGDILISVDDLNGLRRITVTHNSGNWTVNEHWTSDRIKPYFNDFVIHNDYAYGFDGRSIACIDIKDGERKWKGGRYGRGQMVLLADQNLLLVLSEKGKLALVEAVPDGFTELVQFPAIEGKTWNHPVLVGDVLLVRNAREMAAFMLNKL